MRHANQLTLAFALHNWFSSIPRLGPTGSPASFFHVYLNSVQQMVSGELAGEGLQARFSRHGLPPQRAPLDTVYPLREHLNSVQRMVSGGCCEGLFPDTVCWTRLRNTWFLCNDDALFTSLCLNTVLGLQTDVEDLC